MKKYPCFSEGTLEAGRLPDILLDSECDLPPLEKAYTISVEAKSPIKESVLKAEWRVKGKVRFAISLSCTVDSGYVTQQLASKPELLEKISDLFIYSMNYQKLGISKKEESLKEHELPPNLKPLVDQQVIWSKFMEPFWEKNSFHKMQNSRIDEKGYYILPIYGHYLRLPGEEGELEDEFNAMFAFPKTFSPIVEYGWAYWPLEDKKIKLLLWHKDAEKRVAEYYGYLAEQESFVKHLKESDEDEKVYIQNVMEYRKGVETKIKKDFMEALGL